MKRVILTKYGFIRFPEEDFHDDFEDEEDPDDNPLPLGWLIHAVLGLLVLLVLIAHTPKKPLSL